MVLGLPMLRHLRQARLLGIFGRGCAARFSKVIRLLDQNDSSLYPISDQNRSKTISFGEAHTRYSLNCGVPPRQTHTPPPPPCSESSSFKFLFKNSIGRTDINLIKPTLATEQESNKFREKVVQTTCHQFIILP